MSKFGRRLIKVTAVLCLLAALLGGWLWWMLLTTKKIMFDMPLAVVQTETSGDLLSSLLVVRSAARTAGSSDQPDDHRPGEPPPPPEPVIDRWRAEIAAGAYDDWRLLALLSDPHPTDPPLPAEAVRGRLLELAGDNAYVHMLLLGRFAHCCRNAAVPAAIVATAQATRYESPATAVRLSLEDRFRRVPASHFSRLLPEAVFQDMVGQAVFFVSADADGSATGHFHWVCDGATGEMLAACRHLAMLAIRDAEWDHELTSAITLIEQIGTEPQREVAAARWVELRWQAWNVRELMDADLALTDDPAYRNVLYGDSKATRALLRANQIPLSPPPGWTWPKADD